MSDEIGLITSALAAGASGAAGASVGHLVSLVRRALVRHPHAARELDAGETDPVRLRERIGADLADCGAHHNAEILRVAGEVMRAMNGSGANFHQSNNHIAIGQHNGNLCLGHPTVPGTN